MDLQNPSTGFGQFFGQNHGVINTGSKWNPFRKKSGILNVIHAQSKRNRVVSKHGKINTYNRGMDQQERLLKDFFTSLIDLSWAWTIFSFAASFFLSWLFFAVIWYLIALGHGRSNIFFNPLRYEVKSGCVEMGLRQYKIKMKIDQHFLHLFIYLGLETFKHELFFHRRP